MDAQLVLNYDADQTWVGSSIAPNSQSNNTAIWNLPTLAVGATANLTVDLNTPASVPLGTPIDHILNALPDADDETPSNNFILFPDTVVGSFDPNDKLLSPAVMSPSEVQANEKPITYTVRFQNTGTYMAERVVIVDTLPDGLQTESIQFPAGSHSYRWYMDHGVLYILLENINLPDSTSDALNSQGFVSFSLLPDNDRRSGRRRPHCSHRFRLQYSDRPRLQYFMWSSTLRFLRNLNKQRACIPTPPGPTVGHRDHTKPCAEFRGERSLWKGLAPWADKNDAAVDVMAFLPVRTPSLLSIGMVHILRAS